MKDQIQEIEILIRARYPIIYVITWEEDRIESALWNICKAREKRFYIWTITSGIVSYGVSPQAQKFKSSPSRDPLVALDTVIEDTEPAIYMFKDFHSFLQDTTVKRRMRDVANYLRNSYKTLVITSPLFTLPPELEKDITVVDFDLPTRADLEQLLNRIIAEVKNAPEIKINLDGAVKEKLIDAALGLTLKEAENVFCKSLVLLGKLDADNIPIIFSEKQQIIRKSGLLEYYTASENFDEIGGLSELKNWLAKRSLAFSKKATEFGLPVPKGVLFIGVQGCGKSLCAKAVSTLWKVPLLRLDMGRLFSSFVGASEDNVRKAIKIAESVSPTILWIDEIDKSFAGVQSSTFSDAGTTARVFGTFLTWLQEKTAPVFVIATANNISQLPPELLRKGRFDEIFFVDLPNFEERKEIFKIHLRKRGREPMQFDLDWLSKEAEGFSGAEIEQAIISALYDAFEANKPLTTEIIIHNLKKTVPLSKTMQEEIESLRRWAEGRARFASAPATVEEAIGREKVRRIEF